MSICITSLLVMPLPEGTLIVVSPMATAWVSVVFVIAALSVVRVVLTTWAPLAWDASALDHGLGYRGIAIEGLQPTWVERALVG